MATTLAQSWQKSALPCVRSSHNAAHRKDRPFVAGKEGPHGGLVRQPEAYIVGVHGRCYFHSVTIEHEAATGQREDVNVCCASPLSASQHAPQATRLPSGIEKGESRNLGLDDLHSTRRTPRARC